MLLHPPRSKLTPKNWTNRHAEYLRNIEEWLRLLLISDSHKKIEYFTYEESTPQKR